MYFRGKVTYLGVVCGHFWNLDFLLVHPGMFSEVFLHLFLPRRDVGQAFGCGPMVNSVSSIPAVAL